MKTIIIKAVKVENGYVMQAENGEYPQKKLLHKNRQSVYADCQKLYNNITWQGRKVHSGYMIYVD